MKNRSELLNWARTCGEFLTKSLAPVHTSQIKLNVTEVTQFHTALFEGRFHSKSPLQQTHSISWNLRVDLKDDGAILIGGTGHIEPQLLLHKILDLLPFCKKSKSKPTELKLFSYPKLNFLDESLALIIADNTIAAEKTISLVQSLWSFLNQFSHSKLMGRECSVALTQTTQVYWDSIGNHASQSCGSVDLNLSISLSDFSEDAAESFGHLPSEEEIKDFYNQSVHKLSEQVFAALDENCDYTVVLLPQAFLTLLEDTWLPNINTRSILSENSRLDLSDIGQTIAPRLTLVDEPHEVGSPFSQVFDFEGRPSKRCTLFDNGRFVQPLVTASQHAELLAHVDIPTLAKKAIQVTGHASGTDETSFTNLKVDLTDVQTFNGEVGSVSSHVVIVQSLTGMTANPLTGSFSLDAEGARVFEDGKHTYNTNFTLSGTIDDILKEENLLKISSKRLYNVTLPGIITQKLKCVSKDIAISLE